MVAWLLDCGVEGFHIVRTTRNCASPLIMRTSASPVFSRLVAESVRPLELLCGFSIGDCCPGVFMKK